ncbi:MAG: nucleotidyltransferase family protein [Polyangiales bacterium]
MPAHAILLSAGLGTRMQPLTATTPKAMLPLGGLPLLEHGLRAFEAAGCTRIVVNTHHHAAQVHAYLASRPARAEVVISHEPVLLESGGGLMQALPLLGDAPFLAANADTVWLDDAEAPAIARLCEAYDPARMDALLLLEPRARATDYAGPGDFGLNDAGELVRGGDRAYVFRGLQVLHPRALAGRTATPFSLREVWRAAERPDRSIARHFGLVHAHGRWLHVGTPDELRAAEATLTALRSERPAR